MYAFSSAARDLSKAYYNPDINFEYSKFALIDVPVVDTPGAGQNFIQFGNLFEGGGNPAASYIPNGDANIDFAQTLQNYALNFENFIATDDDFDPILYAADSEKIFFKWLTELGAFGVKSANTQQAFTGYSRAIENEDTTNTGNNYSRVVKYLGNIDVSNDKNYQGNSYNEIFVNVPSSVGYTPDILFKSSAYNTTATSYTPLNEINGRASQIHPDGNLTMDSLADNITGTISLNPTNLSNYGIEWDPNVYAKIVNDAKLNNFLDYSKRGGEFKFNAILVYYDIYSKSDASNRATNLYGILILDNFKDDATSTGMSIPTLTKYRPNEVTGLNGNAFALKLNVKFNSSLDNVGVESNINDFTTFSMDIFLDTATAIENASRLMIDASKRYADIAERVEGIEGILLTSGDATDFKARISALEDSLENAALNYADSTSILDMITSVNARLNQVISGTIPTEIQYNTDVISPGDGMEIDISDPTKIKLTNSDYGYKLNDVFGYNFTLPVPTTGTLVEATNPFNMALTASTGMITRVGPYTNMVRIHNDTGTLSGDLNIYLDDSVSTWKKGQTIKFSFKTKLPLLGTYKINIYAEKQNGWVLKGTLDTSNLLSLTPYVELICIDEINKTFELEIIR